MFLTKAQFGDVSERRRWRIKRGKRSGSDLPIGKRACERRQRLSHNRKSAMLGAQARPVGDEASATREKIRSIGCGSSIDDYIFDRTRT